MTSNYKAPPQLKDETTYERWKKEIALWQTFTDLPENKRAPAICLSLNGPARETVLDIEIEILNSGNGVKELLLKLDALYLKDTEQRIYTAYDNFEKFKRNSNMNIADYINEFEKRNTKLKEHKIELPDPVLAYKLLNNSNIGQEKEQLARATLVKLTYTNMRDQLRKIFDESCISNSNTDVKVKTEEDFETFYGRDISYNNRGRGRTRYRGNNYRGNYENRNKSKSTRKKNPLDSAGYVTKCVICKSIFHWAADCPDKDKTDVSESAAISLFNEQIENCYIHSFLGETFNKAILDSGCVQTVCGSTWFQCYKDSLDLERKQRIVEDKSCSTVFKFGDGRKYTSIAKVSIPAMIGNKNVFIETCIVECEIPLLLSRKSMQKAETKIDFANNTATMLKQEIELQFTQSGHYFIDISIPKDVETFFSLTKFKNGDKNKIAIKLHKQFCHPQTEKLCKLLKDAGINDKPLFHEIKNLESSCKTCLLYKKPKSKPIVTFPFAKDFNESVAMDIKFYKSKPILHLIDHATRFSAAGVIKSKERDVVISKVFEIWISVFGSPHQILTDNGGEFANEDFKIMGEKLNIRIKNTAAESPWSNGINERHNAILGNMIEKIIIDTGCSLNVAVASAVSSKNALSNVFGYSPNQLVFGKNPNQPSNLINKLPALEQPIQSSVVKERLTAMHSARKAFVESEACKKISLALIRKTRQTHPHSFQNGDVVYYKRESSHQWKGPGTVIGVENQTIVIKHGSTYVKVHSCRVMHENSEFKAKNVFKEQYKTNKRNEGISNDEQIEGDVENDNYEDIENCESNNIENSKSSESSINEISESCDKDDIVNNSEYNDIDNCETNSNEDNNTTINETNNNENNNINNNETNENNDYNEASARENNEILSSYSSVIQPRLKSIVKMKLIGENDWQTVEIISRAGKATGVYKNWLNIKNVESGNKSNLDWKNHVDKWKPVSYENVLISEISKSDNLLIQQAKLEEITKWKHHEVFEEVENLGQQFISTRWVCTEKISNMGQVIKARLVARGFEEDTSLLRRDSPTCSKEALRIALAIIASYQWQLNSLDIAAAFLQGSQIKRKVFIKPPKEAHTDKLWKLNKCVYGLADASRLWYIRLSEEMIKLGMKKSKYDEAIFYYHSETNFEGIVTTHVDDIFWAGTKIFKQKVIDKVKQTFKISKESQQSFTYLGLNLEQTENCIKIDQQKYVADIDVIPIIDESSRSDVLKEDEKQMLRTAIGQLNWVSTQSRPDLSYETCQASISFKNASIKNILKINKSIKKVKSRSLSLTFKNIGDISKCRIVNFSDASYRNLEDGGSQGGFIIFIVNIRGDAVPLQWQSRRIRRVVRSTLAAECLAQVDAADACFLIKSLLQEILQLEENCLPIESYVDNKSLVDAVYSTKGIEEKRLQIDISALRERIKNQEIKSIKWINSCKQVADCLTKFGASSKGLYDILENGMLRL